MSADIVESISAFVKSLTPDPLRSEDQHDRYYGLDLPNRTEHDLRRELAFRRVVNYLVDDDWSLGQEERIGNELQRRYHKPKAA